MTEKEMKAQITQAHTDGYNRGYAKAKAELENKIADIKANCDLAIEGRDVKIKELEKENKLLGERCNQLLKDKGNLTDELANWKDEWQEQVQKAIDEGYARTQQTIQLTKAKELLAKWVELFKPKSDTALPTPIQVDTEQFLNSEVGKCQSQKQHLKK